ncbi:MAG: PfkB family carbohydrate kinase [Thermosynechococcaceae cyanobacterium]
MSADQQKLGLFIGLSTLDLIYLAEKPPQANQKIVAIESEIASGGPATNAAVTFAHFGHQTQLLTAMGSHPLTDLIRSDLEGLGVAIADLTPTSIQTPPVSSIVVTEATGERAVISLNAQRQQATPEQIPPSIWDTLNNTNIILIDGHQIDVAVAIATQSPHLPIVLDGGSWKPGLEKVLPHIHYAICSANFYPPGCSNTPAVMDYLRSHLPPSAHIAITHGAQPILYWDGAEGVCPVPAITPIDTLGAGDVFHGAFCHFILENEFPEALALAAPVAASACQSFGTRTWLHT